MRWAERLSTVWVGPLALAVHSLGMQPGVVGALGDDALYLDLARSWAEGRGWTAPILPGAPEAAKYPVGWPMLLGLAARLGLDLGAEAGLRWILAANALAWAVAAQLVVDRWLPALGASTRARQLTGLLLVLNTVTMQLAPTAMSEAGFALMLSLAGAIVAGSTPREERPASLLALGAATAAAGLLRSVGSPMALLAAVVALLYRRPRLAGALGAGWLAQAAVTRLVRASVQPLEGDAWRVLHYYAGYHEHTAFYADPARAGQWSEALGRLADVLRHNASAGLRSLSNLAFPGDFVGAPLSDSAAIGLGLCLLLLAAAAAREPRARPALLLLGAYTAIFLAWTWPFSARFWLPVWPAMLALAALGLERLGRTGALLLAPLGLMLALGHSFVPYYRARGLLDPAPPAAEELALEAAVAGLDRLLGPEDVLLGGQSALWLARRVGARGLELEALLPSEDRLKLVFGLADPREARLVAEVGTSLDALDRLLPTGARVWIVLDASSPGRCGPLTAALEAQGRAVRAGGDDALKVWEIRRGEQNN